MYLSKSAHRATFVEERYPQKMCEESGVGRAAFARYLARVAIEMGTGLIPAEVIRTETVA